MIRMTVLKALMLLCLALGIMVQVDERRIGAEHQHAAAAALFATNVTAERDSTRNVAAANRKVAAMLGDSLRLVEKEAVQVSQHGDALDRALGRERRARYAVVATVDSLQATRAAPAQATAVEGTRAATFEIRQAPYTIEAAVTMPPLPDSAQLALHVSIDPIPIEARVTCAPANANGIRAAAVVASSPVWATVRFAQVEQSPDVCASPALVGVGRRAGAIHFTPLVVGAGLTVAANGSSGWRLFIGSGLRIGH